MSWGTPLSFWLPCQWSGGHSKLASILPRVIAQSSEIPCVLNPEASFNVQPSGWDASLEVLADGSVGRELDGPVAVFPRKSAEQK